MAVDNVRTEADNRHNSQYSLAEERKALDVPLHIRRIGSVALEVVFVVHKVELYAVIFIFHYAYMKAVGPHTVVHIEVCHILEIVSVFIGNACIIGHYNSYVKFFFVEILRERSYNVSESAGLDKGYAF